MMADAGLKAPAMGDFIFIHWDQIDMLLKHQRMLCAKVCIAEAERHEEMAPYEDTPDYSERCLVYGKHIRTCAAKIEALL